MPLLWVQNISKRFGGLQALSGVSFKLEEGELVGLIGPNASGKTTLLNVINGYHTPDSGWIRLRGERINGLSPFQIARKGVARMFQITHIFPRMSVLENMLTVGYAIGRIPAKSLVHRAHEILDQLSLRDWIYEPAASLSGGQRKLLEFGACFMAAPRLALLDEPFAGVHPELKAVMERFIQSYHAEGGTVFIVSHDIPALVSICPRLIALHAGVLLADGPTEQVIRDEAVLESYLGSYTPSEV
ncbi:MAG: ABC transporter ATP-binding protein [Armatimonadota bacterium]|nr:ABC transporter ATP-binding protein [Armatimonadota bacterium]